MRRLWVLIFLGGCSAPLPVPTSPARIERTCAEGSGCPCACGADLHLVEAGERLVFRGERLRILGLEREAIDRFEVTVTPGGALSEVTIEHGGERVSALGAGPVFEVPSAAPHAGWWRVTIPTFPR